MENKYAFVIGERRTSLTKPRDNVVWIGLELGKDSDGDPVVLAQTEDCKHGSDFWLSDWMNEMERVK